ncbi:EF-hand domain-containing protein d1 [Plakobranchus ocellatus]|uniref:EF-hand domain-containing protein d1 n=1 Tax=Plakobranchus ocellatus TaxID=259542 RepID=A0AAV3Z855_9GAST|nr:EF-hand domain-containing protein d1 [Plakobranchus ocellatus]
MKAMTLVSLALVMIMFLTPAKADDNPLSEGNSTDASDPPLPTLDIAAFTVEYRVNIIDKKYTMWAKESHDSKRNKLRIDILKNGVKEGLLLDYSENTYISYKYNGADDTSYTCLKEKLDTAQSDNFTLLGFTKETKPSVPHVVSTKSMLQFAKTFGVEYKGQPLIGGLRVDRWQSSITWPDGQSTFTLDYYFTTPDFRPLESLTPSQIPVQARVKGKMQSGSKTRQVDHIYEYLDFRGFEELPAETFSLPRFMICEGESSIWSKTFPPLPSNMHYLLEIVSRTPKENGTIKVSVEEMVVYADATNRLVRVDMADSILLSDFSTGIQYHITQNDCIPRPIDPDNEISASSENNMIKLKDRPEIFYLKQTGQFTGNKVFREISALAFTGELLNSSELFESYVSHDGETPIGTIIKNVQTGSVTQYNIFDFTELAISMDGDKNPFDIRRCRKSSEITDFELHLNISSDAESVAPFDIDTILVKLRDYLPSAVGISVLQISGRDYHLSVQNQKLYWYGSFLGPDPDHVQAKVENKLSMGNFNAFSDVVSQMILNGTFSTEFKIEGFSVKLLGISLHSKLNSTQTSGRDNPLKRFNIKRNRCTENFDFENYSRITNSAHGCARACLHSKRIACNMFQYTKSTKQCTIGSEETPPALMEVTGCNFYTMNYLAHFEAFSATVLAKMKDGEHRKASSAESCAKLCMQEKMFFCKSLDYCEQDKSCQLYTSHFYDKDSNPSQDKDQSKSCTHYSRKSLDNYTATQSTDLQFPGQDQVEANSAQECAYLCSNDERNCTIFSSCVADNSVTCTFVPSSFKDEIKFDHEDRCSVYKIYNSPSYESTSMAKTEGKRSGSGHSKSAMLGVSFGMIVIGIALGALIIYLLRRFNMWNGY